MKIVAVRARHQASNLRGNAGGWLRSWICRRLCLTLGLAACGFPRPPDVAPADGMSCTAGDFIACDGSMARSCNDTGDGTITQDCGSAGCNPDAKRCNQCVPSGDTCAANGSEVDHCSADGLPAGQDACQLGCAAAPAAHCSYIEPRYLPNICDAVATMPAFTIDNVASFDTGLDANCNGGVVHQDGAADICVVRYSTIHIAAPATLTVSGTRALALVADTSLIVDGVLDVGARASVNGPGGGTMLSGDKLGASTGGGGAGFATAGGSGGSATTDGGGGVGGSKVTDPSLLTVLIGGSRPARVIAGPAEGGGGGAATLIACRGQVSVTGTLTAGGGGGAGGRAGVSMGSMFAGAGAGSGGNVVLQGLSIVVSGQVFANGGGGGAGWVPGGAAGQTGGDGTRSASVSATGGVAFGGEGAGGAGGLQGVSPGVGRHPTATGSLPGGGGGSIGFFQTYTPNGITPTLTPSSASPGFGANKAINTR